MKLIEHGTRYIQTIVCDGCGAKYQGTHYDDNVKKYDSDYNYTRTVHFHYYIDCQDCGETISFNRKKNDDGDR